MSNLITFPDIPHWLPKYEVVKAPEAKTGVYRYVINLEKDGESITVEIADDGSTDQKTQMTSHIILLKSMRKTWKLLSENTLERKQAFATGRQVELIQEEAASSVIFKEESLKEEFFYKEDRTKEKRGELDEVQFRRKALQEGSSLKLTTRVHKRCESIAQSVFTQTYPPRRALSAPPSPPKAGNKASNALARSSSTPDLRKSSKQLRASQAKIVEYKPITTEDIQEKIEALSNGLAMALETESHRNFFPARVNDEILSPGLPNLSATCYMNSTLQFIARLEELDHMLGTNPTDYISAQLAMICAQLGDPNPNLPKINQELVHLQGCLTHSGECQQKTCEIINAMRAGHEVGKQDLMQLFDLLSKCGWRASSATHEDPHELLQFMRKIFGANGSDFCPIHLETALSFEGRQQSTRASQLFELNLVPQEGKTMSDLVRQGLVSPISGYKHPQSQKEVTAIATTVYTTLPTTLLVQLKRFDRVNNAIVKNTAGVELLDELKIPVNNQVRHYRLKACITHHGSGVGSGHYTTVAKQEIKGVERWVKYNDNALPCVAKKDDAIDNENKHSGYYLAYELVSF